MNAEDEHDMIHVNGSKYVQIAVILFVLTALEVLLYETCFGHLRETFTFGAVMAPHFVAILLVLSAAKFWFVAMFYMHLKFDLPVLGWVFTLSLTIAVVVICGLFALFTYNRTLWWWSGAWK